MLRAHIDDQALFPAAIGRLIDCRDDLVPVLAPDVVDAPFGCVGPPGGPPPTPRRCTPADRLRPPCRGMGAPPHSPPIPPSGEAFSGAGPPPPARFSHLVRCGG